MRVVYIDIDSTIWPAEVEYDRVAMELFGKPFGENWYNIPELKERFGPNFSRIFEDALHPYSVWERELYPHVTEALQYMVELGLDVHFLSHNPKPKVMIDPVWEWLLEKSGINDFELTILRSDYSKIEFMQSDPFAWAIIDDKVETLLEACEAGYVTVAKQQPWNLTLQGKVGILSFDSWQILPSLLYKRLMFGDICLTG